MKSSTFINTFCCLLIAVSSLLAEASDKPTSQSENFADIDKETRILNRLLQMDDNELAKLRQTIERIEKMSPEEKARLRERIATINRMPPGRVDELRKKFRAIPREQRKAVRARWFEMSPEERARLRSELREMKPEERHAFLKEKGLLPPPPRKGPPPEDDTAISPIRQSRNQSTSSYT